MNNFIYNIEKPTDVDIGLIEISLFVWDRYILFNNKKIPLGQWSTDILNLDIKFIDKIVKANDDLASIAIKLFDTNYLKTFETIKQFQNKINKALDLLLELPPYKYCISKDYGRTTLIDLYQKNYNLFVNQCRSENSEEEPLYKFIHQIFSAFCATLSFNMNVTLMLQGCFEELEKRNNEHYAFGVFSFFYNTTGLEKIRNQFPPIEEFNFSSVEQVGLEYTATKNPDGEGYILAERIVSSSMKALLHIDFFKGLVQGNCPRQCHNCGKYFLLLSGHNTCYCTNIAPNQKDKNKTCRDVGSHNKEREQKENRTPARVEYDKVYNRLKTRKNRGKISETEWFEQTNLAWDYKTKNENGILSDFEYKELMSQF